MLVPLLQTLGLPPKIRLPSTTNTIPVPGPRTFRAFNPFRTAVSFWGQLGTNYLEFECLVPKTGLEF